MIRDGWGASFFVGSSPVSTGQRHFSLVDLASEVCLHSRHIIRPFSTLYVSGSSTERVWMRLRVSFKLHTLHRSVKVGGFKYNPRPRM